MFEIASRRGCRRIVNNERNVQFRQRAMASKGFGESLHRRIEVPKNRIPISDDDKIPDTAGHQVELLCGLATRQNKLNTFELP